MVSSLSQQLISLLGDSTVLPPDKLEGYAIEGLTPRVVVRPSSRQEIIEIMRWASAERLAVVPRGGGTQLSLGNLPQRVDLVLDLSSCHRVLDYQPADLTATVEAGITLEALQLELARGGKFAPLEAPMAGRATIGGILATQASGPLRYTYGLARDWLIGISVVSALGEETKAGGRVVKNVTGYDLNKLYTGSLGTLGVIVEATFKLTPAPAGFGALTAAFPSVTEGLEASRNLLSQVFGPLGVQVISGQAAQRLDLAEPIPSFDRLGPGGAGLVAFFSGRPRSVNRRLGESERLLTDQGAGSAHQLDESQGRSVLRQLTDLGWATDAQPYLGLKINVPPSAVAGVVARLDPVNSLGQFPGVVADVGFGSIRLLWWTGSDGVEIGESAIPETVNRVRELARQAGGSAVVEQCPRRAKEGLDVWGEPPQGIEIMRRIKQNFDPLGILNPGRFIGRL